MYLFIVMGAILLIAIGTVGFLFYKLHKEASQPVLAAVPVPAVQVKESPMLQNRVDHLENELRTISEKATHQSQEAMAMIGTLTKENEKLKAVAEEGAAVYKAKMAELEKFLDGLRQDNSALQGQLDTGHTKVREMQEEIVSVRKHMGDELLAANAQINEFKNMPRASVEDLEKLKKETEDLRKENETLRQDVTKYRAQSSGFERMCANYKIQLAQASGPATEGA